jgi:hypothetical protein
MEPGRAKCVEADAILARPIPSPPLGKWPTLDARGGATRFPSFSRLQVRVLPSALPDIPLRLGISPVRPMALKPSRQGVDPHRGEIVLDVATAQPMCDTGWTPSVDVGKELLIPKQGGRLRWPLVRQHSPLRRAIPRHRWRWGRLRRRSRLGGAGIVRPGYLPSCAAVRGADARTIVGRTIGEGAGGDASASPVKRWRDPTRPARRRRAPSPTCGRGRGRGPTPSPPTRPNPAGGGR